MTLMPAPFRLILAVFLMTIFAWLPASAQTGPGSAVSFNAPNLSKVKVAPCPINADFTIEFWFASTQVTGSETSFRNGVGLADNHSIGNAFGVSLGNGKVVFGTGSPDVNLTSGFLADGLWHHVAATRVQSSGAMVLYIDGALIGATNGTTAALTGTGVLYLGAYANNSSFFTGKMDEVRLWNVVRTSNEIASNCHRILAGTETGLLVYYRFDENTGSSASDAAAAGGAQDGILLGAGWTSSWASSEAFLGPGTPINLAATGVGKTNATFNGSVNPNGQVSGFYFRYGTTTNYGNLTPTSVVGGTSQNTNISVAASLANLLPGTIYHSQLIVTNQGGTNGSGDISFNTLAPPTATTLAASSATSSNVTLNATLNNYGVTAIAWFEYGLTTNYGNSIAATNFTFFGDQSITAIVGGLLPGATYHFRAVATNSLGSAVGNDLTVTLPSVVPIAVTMAATNVINTNSTLNALVNPGGAETTNYFQFGTTTNYGSFSATNVMGGPGQVTNIPVSTVVLNLQPDTLYHYRAIAINKSGTNAGADLVFHTTGVPVVTTAPATALTGLSATLNATVKSGGEITFAWFEYGLTTNYGSFTAAINMSAGFVEQPVSVTIGSLLPGREYYFRAVATNILGRTYGSGLAFTTAPDAPTVVTQPASGILASQAVLNGSFDPNGASTTVWFEYGTNLVYDAVSSSSSAGGINSRPVSMTISNLLLQTQYHYRLAASNSVGVVYGGDGSFTTVGNVPGIISQTTGAITPTNVVLNSVVHPHEANTTAYFEWGTNSSYGARSQVFTLPAATNTQPLTIFVTNLNPGMTYHFRVVASNYVGVTLGNDTTFLMGGAVPEIISQANGSVAATRVWLNAAIHPHELPTSVSFEWGTTTAYGSTGAVYPLMPAAVSQLAAIPITNLVTDTLIHWHVVASNVLGVVAGPDMTVTPAGTSPSIPSANVTDIRARAALLHTTVNANGARTSYSFEYGLTTNYGTAGPLNVLSELPSLSFNGVNSFGALATPVLPAGNSAYTMEAWIQPYAMNSGGIVGWGVPGSRNVNAFRLNGNGLVNYWWDVDLAVSTGTLIDDWHHVAATFDGGTRKIYLDGTLLGSDSPGAHIVSSINLQIGGAPGANYYSGAMKELRVWNVGLTQSALQSSMSNSITSNDPSYANLVGYWPMNEGGGNVLANRTPVADSQNHVPLTNPGWAFLPGKLALTNLSPNTMYHFRVVASNLFGVTYGTNVSFTTLPSATATVQTLPATGLLTNSATANAAVNPNATPTSVFFEYGFDTNYGQVTALASAGSGPSVVTINTVLTNLVRGAGYHYRAVASNEAGVTYGADQVIKLPYYSNVWRHTVNYSFTAENWTDNNSSSGYWSDPFLGIYLSPPPNDGHAEVMVRSAGDHPSTANGSWSVRGLSLHGEIEVDTLFIGDRGLETGIDSSFNVISDAYGTVVVVAPQTWKLNSPLAVQAQMSSQHHNPLRLTGSGDGPGICFLPPGEGNYSLYGGLTLEDMRVYVQGDYSLGNGPVTINGDTTIEVTSSIYLANYVLLMHPMIINGNLLFKQTGLPGDYRPVWSLTLAGPSVSGPGSVTLYADPGKTNVFMNEGSLGGTLTASNHCFVIPGKISPLARYENPDPTYFYKYTPGILRLGSVRLEAGSKLLLRMDDPVTYAQLIVSNNVTLGGFLHLDQTFAFTNFPFKIIDNLSSNAISGTFAGLPEGTVFAIGVNVYSITYQGGDGNDVVISLVQPSISNFTMLPNGGPQLQFTGASGLSYTLQGSSNLVNWLPLTNLVVPSNGLFNFFDTAATNYPTRFYRLRNP